MKKCKQGYYYCYKDKKCKRIPGGYRVGLGGYLRREKGEEKSEDSGETETKKNGNGGNGGNGNGGNGNGGNGNGGNGDGGGSGGVSESVREGWSDKYKKSIDCDNPKGFSQKAHCQGKKKMNEETCPVCGCEPCQCLEGGITEARDGKSAKDKGYSLRDWFKGGGWKQTGGKYDGKPCAKQPGQKTKPYCRDADDRASMSKEEREKRAKKKRKEDPNSNRKGKAKNVTQESYSNWKQELNQLDEFIGGQPGDGYIGHPRLDIKNPLNPPKKKTKVAPRNTGLAGRLGNRATKIERMLGNSYQPEGELVDEGKKDACYHKVKSRYSVWPSAYASGALVKCRKVGAKNWGNKTKNESVDYSNWRDDFVPTNYETTDLIKADPIQVPPSNLQKIEEKCWAGYEKKGMKTMFGKRYPNCVKKKKTKNEHYDWRVELDEGSAWTKKEGKNEKGGLNEKGRKSYEKENPGSNLKRPSKKVGNKRRASFCARMKGMKKKLTSKKTANDPNSRINKSLRAWNC